MINNIVEANIRLQDINKSLEKENDELKNYLLAVLRHLRTLKDEKSVYLTKEISEVLKL